MAKQQRIQKESIVYRLKCYMDEDESDILNMSDVFKKINAKEINGLEFNNSSKISSKTMTN